MNSDERELLISNFLLYLVQLRSDTRDRSHDLDAYEEISWLVDDEPEVAWDLTLQILERCETIDIGNVGVFLLEDLIWRHSGRFEDRFEMLINSDRRFFEAFKYVRMGGVSLATQRRLNAALIAQGANPESIFEFDEQNPDV